MKKLILIFTALAAFNFSLKAEDFSAVNDDGVTLHYNILDITAHTVEVYNPINESGDDVVYKYSGAVNIPATVSYNGNVYSVTSIGNNVFYGSTGLTNITIPNSVTSIGGSVFSGCSSLTNITIPEGVTSIGRSAFYGCSNFTSITIPEGVAGIGEYAFSGCTSLSALTFNADSCAAYYYDYDYNQYISVFTGCPLTNVTIGNNVRYIPAYFIANQEGITSVTIPEGVTGIGLAAFMNCTSLTSITLPNSLKEIGDIEDEYNRSYNGIFEGCTGLTSINIPNSVMSIGDRTFVGCTGITSITIPEDVTSIGSEVFSGCTSLSTLTFNADSCAADYHYDYRDISVFTDCPLTNVTIGDNVNYIPKYFIANQEGITNITIPAGVTSIGESAFYGCSGLASITIPAGVTEIGNSVFEECSSLTNITIQEGVTEIGNSMFEECSSLTNITIPESVTSIGEFAFRSCTGITSITVPAGVTEIGYNAFKGCDDLHYLNITNGDVEVDASVLFGNMALDTLIAPASVFRDVNAYELAYNTTNKLTYLHVTGGEIADDAFSFIGRQKNVIRTVKIGDCTNTELAAEAFNGLRLMDTLILPANLEKISYMSIANCMSLKNIEISAQITEIEDRAFENCRMLNTVTFEENGVLDRIGNWAFYNCLELLSVDIPEGVTEVGVDAFYGCAHLEDISIPASMTTINDNAFAFCANMKSMSVKAIVPPVIEAKTFENVDRAIPVYVPDGSVADYKAHIYWKEFNIIGENEVPTSADIVEAELSFMQNDNTLVFAEEQDVKVFTVGGICIFSGMATEVNIEQAGVYVVVTEDGATKIVIND